MIWLDVVAENLPGPTRLRVRGRSMTPTLRPGDEVVVHPVTAESLAPGDWVVVRNAQGAFLHRYLGRRAGRIVTKGDGRRALDPAWPPEAVLGRVVEAQREGRCFYCRTPGQLRRDKVLAARHRAFGGVWGVLRRVKALFLALLAAFLTVTLVWAAVTLTDFSARVGEEAITLRWETASETQNLGFRLWRNLAIGGSYVDISGFIPSLDEGAGAIYEYEDVDVTPGVAYYYKLEDIPNDGSTGKYTDPVSATIPLNGTPTPTLTPTPTGTALPTSTPTPLPTATPNPYVRFWADRTDLAAGECATLYWQTNNILAVHFDNVGVSGDGERRFCPCVNESHTLRVKYLNGATEELVIALNVTGQCGAPATPETGGANAGATATPRPAATLDPTVAPAPFDTPAPRVTQTETRDMPQATPQTVTPAAPQSADSEAIPAATSTPSSEFEPVAESGTPAAGLLPTRGPVAGASSGAEVENLLSVWLLIVGGIAGAGFVGAGILMWKRQR